MPMSVYILFLNNDLQMFIVRKLKIYNHNKNKYSLYLPISFLRIFGLFQSITTLNLSMDFLFNEQKQKEQKHLFF